MAAFLSDSLARYAPNRYLERTKWSVIFLAVKTTGRMAICKRRLRNYSASNQTTATAPVMMANSPIRPLTGLFDPRSLPSRVPKLIAETQSRPPLLPTAHDVAVAPSCSQRCRV